jgi:hypothetical protein
MKDCDNLVLKKAQLLRRLLSLKLKSYFNSRIEGGTDESSLELLSNRVNLFCRKIWRLAYFLDTLGQRCRHRGRTFLCRGVGETGGRQ